MKKLLYIIPIIFGLIFAEFMVSKIGNHSKFKFGEISIALLSLLGMAVSFAIALNKNGNENQNKDEDKKG
jgi:ABC-type phosphate transport system permease subunit